MSTPVCHHVVHVAGLPVNVYSSTDLSATTGNVAIFFLLHGRTGSAAQLHPRIGDIFKQVEANKAGGRKQERELLIVTFDQRNHGHRLVHEDSIGAWTEGNTNHAIDMYGMFVGTAKDVSYLIDFIPAYIFPSGEATVDQWLVGGISLGGHATWWALRHGCPNYTHLISQRAAASGVAFAPPIVPNTFLSYLNATDAARVPYTSSDPSENPFIGKKILVLSGADDKVVPWVSSEEVVRDLNVGVGVKKVIVYPGVGHEVPDEMVKETGDFIWEHSLSA